MSSPYRRPGALSRRDLLLGLASCAAAGVASRAIGADGASSAATFAGGADRPAIGADGLRPYAWSDALKRSDVVRAEVSAKGDVALVIVRPLGDAGPHFDMQRPALVKRGEVWLCDPDLSACRRLELDDRWVWSAMFSPSGRQLAALTTGGDGRVGLVVWDVAGRRPTLHERVNVDIHGRLRTVGREDQAPSFAQLPLPFVWMGEERILFIAAGQDETPFDELAGPSSASIYARLRGRTFGGERSVRTWTPQGTTCFAGRRLMALEPDTGAMSSLYTGDIRGVSLSGDARWAAILRADGRVAIDPAARQQAPLRFTGATDDPMVSCALALVRLDGGASFDVAGFATVGNAAPSRLPVWSHDSRRVAAASRLSYSPAVATGDDACWEVDVATGSARHWAAESAVDAEFVAALAAANPTADVETVVNARQPVTHPPTRTVGQMSAQAWAIAPGLVAKWVGNSLSLVRGARERLVSDACRSVASPVMQSGEGCLIVATREDGRFEAIAVAGEGHRTHPIETPVGAVLLNATADGRVLFKHHAHEASRLLVSAPGGPAQASPFVLNRHLAEVRRPRAREVERTTADGERLTGILMTPTGGSSGAASPVVLWAYPDSTPSLDSWLTRINDDAAVVYPFQHLLAQGFAVFLAPLPMKERPEDADPLDYVSGLILPWLDVLDRQPEVLPGQYGFWGHSDAGFAALALLATTDRFKAIAAASTFPDLAQTTYSARLPYQTLDCAAHLIQTDRFYYEAADQRYRVGGNLWTRSERWVANSALFRLERAVTPTLLMVGEYDAAPRPMEQVYSVLHGKGVPVELAYYWGEGHVISSPGNLHDLWTRSERFFRRHLQVAARS
ncbi:prolyl oligopeptidase family serine peptidase [Luteimonas sp. Y-2-2-4F]|nr:prolyl oligopeptidase family serine peptidase [Luteimonas sp. Y-2-2-4F]MCD9033791.1 prolyl oligopeptidase family serine peptidase [Luteimonas sp. Y-2-2-4F]